MCKHDYEYYIPEEFLDEYYELDDYLEYNGYDNKTKGQYNEQNHSSDYYSTSLYES